MSTVSDLKAMVTAKSANLEKVKARAAFDSVAPAYNSYCMGRITREDYLDLTGEDIIATMKNKFDLDVDRLQSDLIVYQDAGVLSDEEKAYVLDLDPDAKLPVAKEETSSTETKEVAE